MHKNRLLLFVLATTVLARGVSGQQAPAINEDVRTLVGRSNLQRYKSSIESLSEFGDRRQGTRRNRDAVDWIEAQLGGGWDPLGHTPGDVFTAYKDEDFRLGLNAAQTTLGAVAELVGARLAR